LLNTVIFLPLVEICCDGVEELQAVFISIQTTVYSASDGLEISLVGEFIQPSILPVPSGTGGGIEWTFQKLRLFDQGKGESNPASLIIVAACYLDKASAPELKAVSWKDIAEIFAALIGLLPVACVRVPNLTDVSEPGRLMAYLGKECGNPQWIINIIPEKRKVNRGEESSGQLTAA
jgi:hypothetical protein